MMKPRINIAGMTMAQAISLCTFLVGFITIWIQLEIRIAEVNVDVVNIKQDLVMHKTENRNDLELIRQENNGNTREILQKVDEIQIYLRNKK
jgi:hypothetical protein